MSTGGIVLNKLLSEQDLEQWTRLKNEYFSAELRPAYRAVFKFFDKHNRLPTFEELDLVTRNVTVKNIIVLLQEMEVPDVSLELAVDALIDEFVQDKTLTELDSFVEEITVCDSTEVIEGLQNVVLSLEELVHSSSEISDITDVDIFQEPDNVTFIPLGLNNSMDQHILGAATTELWIFGGFRGSGKSILCSNLQVNEYSLGYVAPYFSIEMTAAEVMRRNVAIQSGVSALSLRNNTLNEQERIKVMQCIAQRYKNGEQFFEDFWKNKPNIIEHCIEFQRKIKSIGLKETEMPIIHSPQLTISDIDLYLQKFKAKYNEKMRIAIVDYINQVEIPGSEDYDWKTQIVISKQLKKLAAKHDIAIISPYQVDEKGNARFSKGLLISVDVAMLLDSEKPEEGYFGTIGFTSDKTRSLPNLSFRSGINWETLKIDPQDAIRSDEVKETDRDIA